MERTRAAATATAALVTLVLAGCGGGSAAGDSAEQDPDAPLEIWIRHAPGSDSEAVAQELAAAFTEQTGIDTTVVAEANEFEIKLQQAAASRDLPDIVINDTSQLGNLVTQGVVREITPADLDGGEQLSEAAWAAAQTADGTYYGVPFNAQAFALFIRSDWREQVGLPEPQSWDDLVALGEAFTHDDPDGNGEDDTYGFNVVGSTTRGYISWFFSSFLWSAGGDFVTGEGGTFTPAVGSPASQAALTWFQDLFCTHEVVLPGSVTMDSGATAEAFLAGRAGIYLTGPYQLGTFDRDLGADKYEVVALPAGPDGTPAALAEGENIYLMVDSANRAGQQQFAEFATSVEGQTIAMNGDDPGNIVRLPVNPDVSMAEVRTDQRWEVFADAYDSGARYVPPVPSWTPFRQTSAETFNAIVSDCDSDVAAELSDLTSTFQEELADQGVAG